MKKYRFIAGASAAVLALGLLTACGQKQEAVAEEEAVIQEEALEETAPEVVPEDEIIIEEPVETEPEEEVEGSMEETEDPEVELPAEQTVLVAELTEIAEDGSMTILPYGLADETMELVIEDYANVDFSAFVAGEDAEALTLAENVLFQIAQDGELVDADEAALMVGSMLIVTTDADGVQTIVIYNPAAEAAA